MSSDANSTRRTFLKSGAVLAAPLVAAVPAAVLAGDGLQARLARLEDEAAIRELHQTWLRRISSGTREECAQLFAHAENAAFDESVHSVVADHSGEPDAIEIAPNGTRATGRFHCSFEIETAIPQDSTLSQMAHAQGSGFIRRTELRILHAEYVKVNAAWSIAKVTFAVS